LYTAPTTFPASSIEPSSGSSRKTRSCCSPVAARSAVDALAGYRNGFGTPRRLAVLTGGLGYALFERSGRPLAIVLTAVVFMHAHGRVVDVPVNLVTGVGLGNLRG
jgi:hypothetical protein